MPPLAFHCCTASLAPLSSQAPSELSCPLCASATAILIGPSPLPAEVFWSLPGALHPAASTTVRAVAIRRSRRIWFSPFEDALVDVLDVPVPRGRDGFVDHRDV